MIVKSSLLLLSAVSAFAADQIPIGASSTACLASTSPNDCCAGGAKTGQVVIGDRTFEFTCGSKLASLNPRNPLTVENAHACASECASDVSCETSAYKAHGRLRDGKNCYFLMGDNMDQKPDEDWIVFTEVFPSCLESDDPNACCSDPTTQEGEVLIDGVPWKWTCKSMLKTLSREMKEPLTVHKCASLCASEGCHGISFRQDNKRAQKCYFLQGDNTDQKESEFFITVTKVVDDVPNPPIPEPGCEEKLQQTEQKLQDCQNNQADPAKLAKCEADKLTLENAEKDCSKRVEEAEKKMEQWRSDHQKCETEKGLVTLDKQKCELEKDSLDSELDRKDEKIQSLEEKIKSLENQVGDLKERLQGLIDSYSALNAECTGDGPDGNCRTNLVDAEPRDDLCIIDAGNKKFKIYYGKLDDDSAGGDLGSARAGSFKECAERCASYKGAKACVRFVWNTDGKDRSCYLRSTGQGVVPTKPSRYSSGQLL
ncbi:hypothetical protein ZTR_09743 [Talaromyces verruculosus]|nr:hypothetical protein ZTR_09743 [Talaromyces verruculosus]